MDFIPYRYGNPSIAGIVGLAAGPVPLLLALQRSSDRTARRLGSRLHATAPPPVSPPQRRLPAGGPAVWPLGGAAAGRIRQGVRRARGRGGWPARHRDPQVVPA